MRTIAELARPLALEGVWAQAEALGRVSLQEALFGGGYEASITWRLGESSIISRGKGDTKIEALLSAMDAVCLLKK